MPKIKLPKPDKHEGYSVDKVRAFVRREVVRLGSQGAFARAWKISDSHVSDILHGRRDPGPEVLTAFSLAKRALYVPVEAGAER
jgi:hypothetical protein